MQCKVCLQNNNSVFTADILDKYRVKYYKCFNCGFLYAEEPYWLDEAYKDSINVTDTGYMQRNLNFSKKLTILLSFLFNKKAKFLDYAGGYGVFVRMMRDIGFDFYWDDKFTQNLFVRGFEYNEKRFKIDAITTFESFEHFVNPIEEIEQLLSISNTIICSTELIDSYAIPSQNWWYYGFEHGQHISFFCEKTFQFIANKYMLNYYNFGSLQVLTKMKIPFYIKILLKFNRFGLHYILKRRLNSKTWEDYLTMSKKYEN